MAQSTVTVTTPNPTPPTNMSFLGTTPPTAPSQPTVQNQPALTTTAFAIKVASVDNANFPSVDAEGRGTEVVVTSTYSAGIFIPGGTTPIPAGAGGPLVAVSAGAAYTTNPNRDHASSLSPATNPTLSSASGASNVSGSGTTTLTATGTGFTKQSVIWSNGIAYPTTFVSSTSLTATAPKKATAGTLPVKVVTGGAVETATVNWTFT